MSEEPKYPEIHKVIGAPGTGKTTRVVGNPELGLNGLFIDNLDEYSIDDQMIVTYTKAGVEEAQERLYKMLNEPKYRIEERVTTIHSQCYSVSVRDEESLVRYHNRESFCNKWGLEFDYSDDDDDLMAGDETEGNVLFKMYEWLKNNWKSLEDYEDCPIEFPGSHDPLKLMKDWEDFKSDQDLVEFTDMIERAVLKGKQQVLNLGLGPLFADDEIDAKELFEEARRDPSRTEDLIENMRGKGAFVDTKVLYVDEVQDLTPAQWRWYLLQKLICERVFIGGDDDQTIYGWAGANPEFMLDEEGSFEVLDRTYRIPENIWEQCDDVIQQVDKRQEKEVQPDGEGGEFVALKKPRNRKLIPYLEQDDVFVLLRARYMIDNFRNDLHELGIPYRNVSTFDTWTDDIVNLRDGLAALHNDEDKVPSEGLQTLIDYASDSMLANNKEFDGGERVMGMFNGIDAQRARELFNVGSGIRTGEFNYVRYLEMCDDINYYEKAAIVGNINEGRTDLYPDHLTIGTIHSAKGKEAETVILATDSTGTIIDNMNEEVRNKPGKMISDAERRVYYVGMTRASDTLVLVENMTGADCAISIDHLLEPTEEVDSWQLDVGQQTISSTGND